nr:MAG TPA: C2H2 type zinc-finger protein [Caudoviricetes sp.]
MSKQGGWTKGRKGEKQLKFKAKCDKCGREFFD